MLECNVIYIFLHIIYAYVVTFTLFICLIQIQNTEINRKSAKKYRYECLLILPSPTLKKRAFGNMLLDVPSFGLRREAKIYFFLTEFMPYYIRILIIF